MEFEMLLAFVIFFKFVICCNLLFHVKDIFTFVPNFEFIIYFIFFFQDSCLPSMLHKIQSLTKPGSTPISQIQLMNL